MSQASAKRTSLLIGCGSAALALGLALGTVPAAAQGIQAGGNVVFGDAAINNTVPGQTTVTVSTPTTVINWTPAIDNFGNAFDFLPTGNTAIFRNNTAVPAAAQISQFAVLNRILPAPSGNIAVIDGNVISRIFNISGASAPGGFVAFYSPTGILVGNNASFDVGQLMLTTLDTTPASFDLFAQNGFGLQLAGATGSTARILIQPGAQILASPENAFFAVVAADVEMLGTARVNGSHAYIAGEVVNLSFSNGLFNIQVPVGTSAADQVVTIDGTVGGPSSTGAGDNHLIYAVARASSDPISMLFRGNLGFDPAQSAGIVNGEIIISANYNVFGRFVDGGSVSQGINATFAGNSELTDVRADIFLEDFAASSSLLAIGTHRTQVTARTTASSVAGNLIMVGRENSELTASNGQNFTITGDVLVSAQDYGVSGSGLQSLDVLNATGGVAFIDAFGGGSLRINGSALVAADAFAGAEILQGRIGTATAGQALIGSTGGTLVIDGDATVTARGVGPSSTSFFSNSLTGAVARGGLAQFFSVQGGNVTLGGALLLDASASATGSLNIATTTASNAFGGNAFLNVFNGAGSITIGNGATVRANATGGDANFAGLGGTGDAGQAIVDVNGTGVIDITGNVITEAFGIGGDNRAGTGGTGLGGRAAATTVGGGQILIEGDYSADASGRGGDGTDGGDGLGGIAIGIAGTGLIDITGNGQVLADGFGGNASLGFGGNGGIGRGGNAAFQANGTLNQTATLTIGGDATVLATGTGGQGGAAFIQTGTPAGRGGDGFGGDFGTPNQADPAFNSGAFLLAGADRGNLSVGGSAFVSAEATGGRGGAGESTLNGGQGGNATGGLAQVGLALLGGNGSVGLGAANFGDVLATTSAFGGSGGQTFDFVTGNGGAGTGGFAAFTVRAGDASAAVVSLDASGIGGDGQVAGTGTGGAAAVLGSLGGTLVVDQLSATANGNGGFAAFGTGGSGIGGEAAIEGDGITVTVNGDAVVEANGRGGSSDGGGPGGTGTGGSAYIATTQAGAAGTITVTGHGAAYAVGFGGNSALSFAAGSGTGGTAYVEAFNGSTINLGALQAAAFGQGGNSISHQGGDGTGGTVRLGASGTGSQLTIARNVSAGFAADSIAREAFITVNGIGADTTGGNGIGGVGRGGTIAITAAGGGAINLPLNILADPARAADQLLMLARGIGGGSSVDGGAGGAGFGGNFTMLVDGGTLISDAATLSAFAQGGSSLDGALNISGGAATGGSRTIRAINNGLLTIETAGNGFGPQLGNETGAGAQGGNGSGTGNGGDAVGGQMLFEVTDSTANLIGRFILSNSASGGMGRQGGSASANTITVIADNAVINMTPNASGFAEFGVEAFVSGGTGTVAGGNATGGNVDVTFTDSQFGGGALLINQQSSGGPVSPVDATGGNATAGVVRLTAINSTLNVAGALDVVANSFGGAGGANAVGGNAAGGAANVILTGATLTVGPDAQGAPGRILIRADGEGGQGGTIGSGFGGTASLVQTRGSINTGGLLISAQGRTTGQIGLIGSLARGGTARLSLGGSARLDATMITVNASAESAPGGSSRGGSAEFTIADGSTATLTAAIMSVLADALGVDPMGDYRAGRFLVDLDGGNANVGSFTASAIANRLDVDPLSSRISAVGGSLNVAGALNALAFADLLVEYGSNGFIGNNLVAPATAAIQIESRGSLTVQGIVPSGGVGSANGATGGIRGQSVDLLAGRSIFLDGRIFATTGGVSLTANLGGGAVQSPPNPSVITMAADALIDSGTGDVTIRLLDGGSDPQRQTGAITLANISAATIDVRHFGTSPGSDIFVLGNGVLTASGMGRAIDLASLHGEVINLHGDAGLILTGGGHFGIFAETPQGSQIGSLDNYQRRYGVPDAVAYDAIDLGGNFAAFRFTPVITVTPADFSRFYGDPDPALAAFFDGFLPGDSIADVLGAPDFFVSADQFSDIGTYLIETGLGSLFSVQGYAFQFLPGTLTIDPRPITVTANDLSRIYGDGNPALTFGVGGLGLVNGDQLFGDLETLANITSGVGSFAISQGTLSASSNYALTFVDGTLTVTPRPITITADSFSRIYGNANPAFSFSLGGLGLVNGDQLSGSLATTAGLTSGVGQYAITQGTLTAGANYLVTYNAGALTVTPRPITITAGNFSRVYGDANPALTFTVGGLGLVNGDQLTGALGAAGVTAGVGTSQITLGTLAATANYAVTFVPGTLTITPRPLTVAADNLSKSLGLADPLLTFSITAGDLVNGDQLSGSLVRDPGETIASFVIRQGTLSAGNNYTLTFVPGTFTINPPPVSQEINNPTIFEPPVVIDSTPPPVAGEVEERFGIDFPEQPEAPLISEDPLLDDPVATGGDSTVYDKEEDGAATPPAGGQ